MIIELLLIHELDFSIIVFTSRCSVTVSNSGDSSTLTSLPAGSNSSSVVALNTWLQLTHILDWPKTPAGSSYDTDRIQNTASNNSFFVAWLFVTAKTCLLCRCLAMDIFSGSAIPAFIRHVTIFTENNRTTGVCTCNPRHVHMRQSCCISAVPVIDPSRRYVRIISGSGVIYDRELKRIKMCQPPIAWRPYRIKVNKGEKGYVFSDTYTRNL
jgi:hypothetical protein